MDLDERAVQLIQQNFKLEYEINVTIKRVEFNFES